VVLVFHDVGQPGGKGAGSVGSIKWVLIVVMIGCGVQVWHHHQRAVAERELAAVADSNGFVPIVTAPGSAHNVAIVLAALNCPSAQAQRADALAAQLTRLGVANQRANNYFASINSRDQMPLLNRTNTVLGGEIPIVIINGRAKANPTAEEVQAEYSAAN
jgi:hypothetical protein